MITITKEYYKCELCNTEYPSREEAVRCESKPVYMRPNLKIGDKVLITRGEGVGHQGKITAIKVLDMNYGHYFPERYHHTVALNVDVIGSWGSRFLTFDDYQLIIN